MRRSQPPSWSSPWAPAPLAAVPTWTTPRSTIAVQPCCRWISTSPAVPLIPSRSSMACCGYSADWTRRKRGESRTRKKAWAGATLARDVASDAAPALADRPVVRGDLRSGAVRVGPVSRLDFDPLRQHFGRQRHVQLQHPVAECRLDLLGHDAHRQGHGAFQFAVAMFDRLFSLLLGRLLLVLGHDGQQVAHDANFQLTQFEAWQFHVDNHLAFLLLHFDPVVRR